MQLPRGSRRLSRITAAVATLILAFSDVAALAQVTCQSAKMSYAESPKDVTYSIRASSTSDNALRDRCTATDWSNPLDNWRYGDYDWLYDHSAKPYTKKEREKAEKSRDAKAYVKNMKRKVCTDIQGNLVGYYALADHELTFLCVDPGHRGSGIGAQLLQAARDANGADKSLVIKALPSAIPFYASFDIQCARESQDKVTVTAFTIGTGPLDRRHLSFDTNLHGGAPKCRKLDYGCIDPDQYADFTALARIAVTDFGARDPFAAGNCDGTIAIAAATRDLCEVIGDHHDQLDHNDREVVERRCH